MDQKCLHWLREMFSFPEPTVACAALAALHNILMSAEHRSFAAANPYVKMLVESGIVGAIKAPKTSHCDRDVRRRSAVILTHCLGTTEGHS